MMRKNPVFFQSIGSKKEYHHLNEEEHDLVAKALFTGFGGLCSDGIVIGTGYSGSQAFNRNEEV